VEICLLALAIWILISGLDDLFIAAVHLWTCTRQFPERSGDEPDPAEEAPLAILVPLWHEHRVIGRMLEHNLSVLRYSNYQVFVGVYPNDPLTERAVSEIAAEYPNVHLARVPNAGPTSKGDCLNAAYRAMELHEMRHGWRCRIVVTHDAEDLLHPDSLRLINRLSRSYDMVQIPVLPLATGAEWTHGVYCDDFAEFQLKGDRS
jgi:bacteriophage N4 adsorption protein B